MGTVTFDGSARYEWGLNDPKTENIKSIEAAIQHISLSYGLANTPDALNVTRENIFSTTNGDR